MKAIRILKFGNADELKTEDIEIPKPSADEVLIKLAYAGVNYIDVYMRSGGYNRSDTYKTPLPMTLGMEGVGTVAAIGSAVSGINVGDRVGYFLVRGSYAEFATAPAWRVVKLPDDVPWDIGTTLMLQGCTAHYLTRSAYKFKSGSTCLVHAGAGGVGQLLIQMAKLRGATVIATVGSADKARIAKQCGADHVVLYREQDFQKAVMEITGGKGVNVVYDSVGVETISKSIRSLQRRGLCVNYGGASGLVQSIDPMCLSEAGSVFYTRPNLADYTASADEISLRTNDLFDAWRAGELAVTIDRQYSLADTAKAHAHLEARGTRGKLLIAIAP